jgi:hypothetical protein
MSLMTSEPAEFYWTFDCSLILWAVTKFGLDSLKGPGLRSALFAANCKSGITEICETKPTLCPEPDEQGSIRIRRLFG